MKKTKILMLCTILLMGALSFTACGGNQNNGTEAPYEDETNKKVNDNNMYNNNNGTNNNGTDNNGTNGSAGSDLQDAGRNLMDSIKDTGDAIRDGVDNLGNGTNNNNKTNP